MEEKEYVTLTLTSGQVIMSKMNLIMDDDGYYTLESPMKPIILTESNNIALVAMNPFSESIQYKIHGMHIMTVGALDVSYIEVYDNAVLALEKKTKEKYDLMFDFDEEIQTDDEDDEIEIFPETEISKTIH
jgi:hypothetical protein